VPPAAGATPPAGRPRYAPTTRTRRRTRASPHPIPGQPACGLVLLCLVAFAFLHGSLWEVFVVMTVAGYGVGALYAATPGFILRSAPPGTTTSAMSFNLLAHRHHRLLHAHVPRQRPHPRPPARPPRPGPLRLLPPRNSAPSTAPTATPQPRRHGRGQRAARRRSAPGTTRRTRARPPGRRPALRRLGLTPRPPGRPPQLHLRRRNPQRQRHRRPAAGSAARTSSTPTPCAAWSRRCPGCWSPSTRR
jgi:hypothetical protein